MLYIILILIISLTLFIITQYLRVKHEYDIEYEKDKQEYIEQFNTEQQLPLESKLLKYHNISIQFKNASDARKLITSTSDTSDTSKTSETLHTQYTQYIQYIQNMNQPNILARGCFSKDELYNKYLDAFSDIGVNERQKILKFILDLLDKVKTRNTSYYNYLCYWIKTISIAKAKPWLESGMPHTLENTIIMDASWFANPRINTFIHEITHVHQRLISFEYEDLYKELGYKEYKKGIITIKGMNSVIALNRNNPDGLSPNWLWYDKQTKTYWWIGAVFSNITPSSLTDVSNIALKLECDNNDDNNDNNDITHKIFYYLKQQPVLLNSLTNFNVFFGNNLNNYHPNEMTAKFSEWYFAYIVGNTQDTQDTKETQLNEGFKIYKKYFDYLTQTFYK